ncbi:MAG: helix-turn-helix domain-containing protein [Christensenellales bacterium]|jgi:DNA-binding XRE family transcriptional regulator
MNEAEFRRMLADNLTEYRKMSGMTQAEVAARINYSDKSVSKWERADGSPDVFVLKTMADLYGIALADLFAPAPTAPPAPAKRRSPFLVCLSVGGVWLIATIAFSVLNMLPDPPARAYLAFIYAIPASFGAMEVFAAAWKLPAILHLLFSSAMLWTTALSVHLSVTDVANLYLLYVIAAVAQLLGIFALGLYWEMIHMPKYGLRFRRAKEKKDKY